MTNNDSDVPVGTIIVAKVDGVEKGRITVKVAGMYGGSGALDEKLLVQGGLSSNDVVNFYMGDNVATQEVHFSSGIVRKLNLTFSEEVTTTGGGGGGGGSSYVPPTSTGKMGDSNGDNKVDKYDFALMMSAWGKTGIGLVADLNKDGKVNKYDFALLMSNWGI
ncbi:hypothetical protein KJ671_00840 [Patescibacteria group bacterium]|nr:hypothetical protein [Patescibacteria group bacterium]